MQTLTLTKQIHLTGPFSVASIGGVTVATLFSRSIKNKNCILKKIVKMIEGKRELLLEVQTVYLFPHWLLLRETTSMPINVWFNFS